MRKTNANGGLSPRVGLPPWKTNPILADGEDAANYV
jgi:hypothetical protein